MTAKDAEWENGSFALGSIEGVNLRPEGESRPAFAFTLVHRELVAPARVPWEIIPLWVRPVQRPDEVMEQVVTDGCLHVPHCYPGSVVIRMSVLVPWRETKVGGFEKAHQLGFESFEVASYLTVGNLQANNSWDRRCRVGEEQ